MHVWVLVTKMFPQVVKKFLSLNSLINVKFIKQVWVIITHWFLHQVAIVLIPLVINVMVNMSVMEAVTCMHLDIISLVSATVYHLRVNIYWLLRWYHTLFPRKFKLIKQPQLELDLQLYQKTTMCMNGVLLPEMMKTKKASNSKCCLNFLTIAEMYRLVQNLVCFYQKTEKFTCMVKYNKKGITLFIPQIS